jgi:hypothetical protein
VNCRGPWHGKDEPSRRDQRTPTRAEEEDRADRTVLLLLLDRDRPWPCSEDELARELGTNPEDSLARLHGAGLSYRLHEFAWASRAAVRVDELGL